MNTFVAHAVYEFFNVLNESKYDKHAMKYAKSIIRNGKQTFINADGSFAYDKYVKAIGIIKSNILYSRIYNGKFMAGLLRLIYNDNINAIKQVHLNKSLRAIYILQDGDKFDENLNNLSVDELYNVYKDQIAHDLQNDKQRSANRIFKGDSEYTIIPINTFEDAEKYGSYCNWCVTQRQQDFNLYTNLGSKFYFCIKKNFENIKKAEGNNCPLDEYGLSMISVLVGFDGDIDYVTTRWNHENNGENNINLNTAEQIENIINKPFYETFKPYTSKDFIASSSISAEFISLMISNGAEIKNFYKFIDDIQINKIADVGTKHYINQVLKYEQNLNKNLKFITRNTSIEYDTVNSLIFNIYDTLTNKILYDDDFYFEALNNEYTMIITFGYTYNNQRTINVINGDGALLCQTNNICDFHILDYYPIIKARGGITGIINPDEEYMYTWEDGKIDCHLLKTYNVKPKDQGPMKIYIFQSNENIFITSITTTNNNYKYSKVYENISNLSYQVNDSIAKQCEKYLIELNKKQNIKISKFITHPTSDKPYNDNYDPTNVTIYLDNTHNNYIKNGIVYINNNIGDKNNQLIIKNNGHLYNIINKALENKITDLNWINISNITDLSYLFKKSGCDDHSYSYEKYNIDISDWDVSNVTNMQGLFYCRACIVPLDISKWNVSKVEDMSYMFYRCRSFNQPLNNWNVSKVEDMSYMFNECEYFNQPLNNWKVSNVKNMSYMFYRCQSFNQPLNNWNVSNVENMSYMFYECQSFNQPLNNWNVSNVENMSCMFCKCKIFNQPLNNWKVDKVKNMVHMFSSCDEFNQPLNNWKTFNVTNAEYMFTGCKKLDSINRELWYTTRNLKDCFKN